jgi:gentisate 1,2-dioxygenase
VAERASAVTTVYHVIDGAVSMYIIDAKHALSHKDEWKDRPWKESEVEAYKRRKAKAVAKGIPVDDEPAEIEEEEQGADE